MMCAGNTNYFNLLKLILNLFNIGAGRSIFSSLLVG